MLKTLKKYRIQLIFLLCGMLGGLAYWKFIGCQSGTCPIKSVWYYSTLWGGALGYLIGDWTNDMIVKKKKKDEQTI